MSSKKRSPFFRRMRIGLACRSFFKVLGDRGFAARLRDLLDGAADTAELPPEPEPAEERNDAITLLAALQREGRFVDFLMEPLDDFSDADIGAVARDIHRQCRETVQRFFALRPLADAAEGSELSVSGDFDNGQFKLGGQVEGKGPYRGRIAHPGWQASRIQIPDWSGSDESVRVVAPTEVEVG